MELLVGFGMVLGVPRPQNRVPVWVWQGFGVWETDYRAQKELRWKIQVTHRHAACFLP